MINELTASDTPWLDHKNDGNNEPVVTSSDVLDSTKELDKHSSKGAFEAPELSSQEAQHAHRRKTQAVPNLIFSFAAMLSDQKLAR